MNRVARLSTFFLLMAALATAGCRTGMYPVTGTVTFDNGQPAAALAGGFVTFQSVDGAVSSQGAIQPDGSFTLSTQSENDGAYPGAYRVLITPPPHHFDERRQPDPIIDAEYSDPRTSGLRAIVEEKANQVQLRLKRAGER